MKLSLFFALIMSLILSSCQSEKKIELKFTPAVGQSFRMILIKKQVITESSAMGDRKSEITSNTGYRFFVKDKQQYTTTLDVSIESVKLRLSTPQGTFQFNSAKPGSSTNFLSFIYRQMIGQKVQLILKTDGEVLSVRGLDAWAEHMLDSLGVSDQKMRESFKEGFRQFYSENTLRAAYNRVFNIFPDKKIKLNETWERTLKLDMPVAHQKKESWKLIEYTPEKAVLELYAKISSPDSGDTPELPQLKSKYHVWGIETASFEIDPRTGWILAAKRLSYIKSKITLENKSQKALKVEVPIKFQEQIRFLPVDEVL
ncbi:hypothetical protein Calab_0532 [Caldithrix abyssi DSM 13497]|uniref:Lipoprotein n=1 Tax=Caldithrix abyssi DSM 13497 TaxID=880073 RepID=H1XRM3_CALAY|nr:DUF6263 family protein [Caldithrix abyssi]APF20107.1 hypothetical protein Cabys_3359 [Caldithrix abyssi DSM 13497]EHO40176.1 hypothetical protein Calab_0532 [Caldithrix abyssi DSM 13497]